MLSLNDSDTRTTSGASNSKIDTAIRIMNDSSNGLSKSDRITLVKKATEYGINGTINANLINFMFFKAIMGGESENFLKDVWTKFDFLQNNNISLGYNGRRFCSSEYINSFELDIFSKQISSLVSGNKRNYGGYAKKQLEQITQMINQDIKKAIKNYGAYLYEKNRKRIEKAEKQLARCSFDHNRVDLSPLSIYNVDDITQRLRGLMIQGEYKIICQKRFTPLPKEITQYFISLVASGKIYDLKSRGWNKNFYLYDGLVVRNDGPGNILFGYLACAVGYPSFVSLMGAGGYQLKGEVNKLVKLLKNKNSGLKDKWEDFNDINVQFPFAFEENTKGLRKITHTYFDDPMDQEMIRMGIDYYKSIH